ncbi:MAG TPA: ribonuclease E/G, partial [Myxococcota bacterium]|nr:ribonuclease E/G [Myxococcota bacterium]
LLCEAWQQIDKGAQLGRAPTLLYREPDIVIRTIRDYFSSDVSRIVIDDEEEYEDALTYFREYMPDLVQLLERHRKREPIFHYFGIEKAISELFDLEVKLPSGGYITIEQTEALVSIDVNSGSSTKEEDHEATVYKTNLEAADEIARQLRLRDMGGIVVIDFIDMVSRWHRRDVERRLRDLMRNDKARVKLGRISENGILELTRQRLRQSHSMISRVICTSCGGTGRVRDVQGLSLSALRRIAAYLAKKRVQLSKLSVKVPVEVANLLNNRKRKDLLTLCDNYEVEIDILGDTKLNDAQIEFYEERRGYAGLRAKAPLRDYWEGSEGAVAPSRRGKQGFPEGYKKPKSELPIASIGPVPTLIDLDMTEESIEQAVVAPKKDHEHFEDEIAEALFGMAPKKSLEEMLRELAPNSVMSNETEEALEETKNSFDEALDVDSINESLSGIDDIGVIEKKDEERAHKGRFMQNRRRSYRQRRPDRRPNEKYAAGRGLPTVDAEPKIPTNKNRHDGLSK